MCWVGPRCLERHKRGLSGAIRKRRQRLMIWTCVSIYLLPFVDSMHSSTGAQSTGEGSSSPTPRRMYIGRQIEQNFPTWQPTANWPRRHYIQAWRHWIIARSWKDEKRFLPELSRFIIYISSSPFDICVLCSFLREYFKCLSLGGGWQAVPRDLCIARVYINL